ncbi:MAG: hypothetical protein ACU0CA_14305 [Paracoccaceae bacterium]
MSTNPEIIGPYSDLTTAIPTNRLYEMHDSLVLALDATAGSVSLKGLNEARSLVSAALNQINKHLPVLEVAS